MKQVPLLQGKALLIEMPNLKLITTIHKGLLVAGVNQKDVSSKCRKIDRGDAKGFLQLPPGNWRIIGMLSEVTEDDLTDVIDVLVSSESGKNLYPNLTGGPWKVSRIESLESAIEVEGYYLDENPMGSISPNSMDYKTIFSNPEARAKAVDAWNEAQSRVLDRSRCLLLGRESKTLKFMGFKIKRK